MASRLVKALESLGPAGKTLLDDGRILRFGHSRLPEVTGERRLFPSRDEIQRLRKALHEAHSEYRRIPDTNTEKRALHQKLINDLRQALRDVTKKTIESASIVLTTAVQTCLEPSFELGSTDMVVIDEASMMPVPVAMCAAGLAKTNVVVTGDFRQLGPIALAKSEVALKWLHRDVFSAAGISGNAPAHPGLTMLHTQRRMHRDIRDMVNRPFYGGLLTGEADASRLRATALGPLPGLATVLVKATSSDGSKVQTTEAQSRVNEFTANVTAQLAVGLAKRNPEIEVGVITPYRGQVSAIKRLLKYHDPPAEAQRRVRVGTVHAFQGSEADVIIWDLVDTPEHTIGKLYQGEAGDRLANVAISRAQGKLVVIGDPDAFFNARGSEMVRAVKNILFHRFVGNKNTVRVTDLRM